MATPRYRWQTQVFHGVTAEEATNQFDQWFGYGTQDSSITRQRIRRQADGSLHLYLSHHPSGFRYEIHVTVLIEVTPGEES